MALRSQQRQRRCQPGGVAGPGRLQECGALLRPFVDARGGHLRVGKVGVGQQVGQKAAVVTQAQERRVRKRGAQAADGVAPVPAIGYDLGHHRVVIGRHGVAFLQAVVDAHATARQNLGLPPEHPPGLRRKTGVGVFGVQARLDGVAGKADVGLRQRQRLACGHAQLPLHQVQPGNEFGHRVFHLQPGVHLQKVVAPLGVHDKFHRACALVADGQRGGYGVCAHGGALRGAHDGGRRFFNHLLAAALGGAVALAQVHRVAVLVGKHLNLDMAAVVNQALEHQGAVAKGA